MRKYGCVVSEEPAAVNTIIAKIISRRRLSSPFYSEKRFTQNKRSGRVPHPPSDLLYAILVFCTPYNAVRRTHFASNNSRYAANISAVTLSEEAYVSEIGSRVSYSLKRDSNNAENRLVA